MKVNHWNDSYYKRVNTKERVMKNRCKDCNKHPIDKQAVRCKECEDKRRKNDN